MEARVSGDVETVAWRVVAFARAASVAVFSASAVIALSRNSSVESPSVESESEESELSPRSRRSAFFI